MSKTDMFAKAVEFVLTYEGDNSNDVRDPGQLTKWGISSRFYPEVFNATFSREDAVAIYRKHYWDACQCAQLPEAIALILFDSAVNQGKETAVKLLQTSLNVKADGIVGAATIAACARSSASLLVPEMVARRGVRYAADYNVTTFGLGWYRRLAACHQVAMGL